jgi:activator of HSP90 ATPase
VPETKNSRRLVFTSLSARLRMVVCVALAFAGLAMASTGGWPPAKAHSIASGATYADDSPRSIHQETDFKASPQRIYEALLDSKQFGEFTGLPARISHDAGGAFSLFDGYITGRNIELLPNRRIVQAWRAGSWDEGVYSIVRFELKPLESGTHLIMDHDGFPAGAKESLNSGWKGRYWDPLRKYLD